MVARAIVTAAVAVVVKAGVQVGVQVEAAVAAEVEAQCVRRRADVLFRRIAIQIDVLARDTIKTMDQGRQAMLCLPDIPGDILQILGDPLTLHPLHDAAMHQDHPSQMNDEAGSQSNEGPEEAGVVITVTEGMGIGTGPLKQLPETIGSAVLVPSANEKR